MSYFCPCRATLPRPASPEVGDCDSLGSSLSYLDEGQKRREFGPSGTFPESLPLTDMFDIGKRSGDLETPGPTPWSPGS